MSTFRILKSHLEALSHCFPLYLDDNYRFVIVRNVKLPPGFNRCTTDVLVELPRDYPMSPPGLGGNRVYITRGLLFHNRVLKDYHTTGLLLPYSTPGFGPWAWFCYENIRWNPMRDNLIGFIEMLRADLTNPPFDIWRPRT